MNVFFLNCVDPADPGLSAHYFKGVDLATFVTPFTIHKASSWFILLSIGFASLFWQ